MTQVFKTHPVVGFRYGQFLLACGFSHPEMLVIIVNPHTENLHKDFSEFQFIPDSRFNSAIGLYVCSDETILSRTR